MCGLSVVLRGNFLDLLPQQTSPLAWHSSQSSFCWSFCRVFPLWSSCVQHWWSRSSVLLIRYYPKDTGLFCISLLSVAFSHCSKQVKKKKLFKRWTVLSNSIYVAGFDNDRASFFSNIIVLPLFTWLYLHCKLSIGCQGRVCSSNVLSLFVWAELCDCKPSSSIGRSYCLGLVWFGFPREITLLLTFLRLSS